MRERQKAEDILQETYIRVFKSIHKYEETGTLAGWLTKIAVNGCLKELKKNKRLSFQEEELLLDRAIELPDVYEKLSADDLLTMLDRLPASYRIIFNLHIIEGYTHREISDMLGIQVSLSRTKLTRARKMLQEYYFIHYKKSIV
jgi:RNA polymerase sigma-70 factor (ECF subfamily)